MNKSCLHSPFEIDVISDASNPYDQIFICQGCNQTIDGYGQNTNFQHRPLQKQEDVK